MKLNVDCVRDILLCVEDNAGLRASCNFVDYDIDQIYSNKTDVAEYQKKLEEKYHNDEIIYHINYCVEAGLLKKRSQGNGRVVTIDDLTPLGHQFIGNLRNENIWKKVKDFSQKSGGVALGTLIEFAATKGFDMLKSIL